MIDADELSRILGEIQKTEYANVQSIDLLLTYGFKMAQYMAYSGQQQALAKEALHKARRQGYVNLVASLGSQKKVIGPMLMKDYVNDQCAYEHKVLELAERANKAATHSIELCRTAISVLKQEMISMSFQPSA